MRRNDLVLQWRRSVWSIRPSTSASLLAEAQRTLTCALSGGAYAIERAWLQPPDGGGAHVVGSRHVRLRPLPGHAIEPLRCLVCRAGRHMRQRDYTPPNSEQDEITKVEVVSLPLMVSRDYLIR